MSQTQTGNELDRRTSPRQSQVQIPNNEPNSTLYVLTPNVKTKPQMQQPKNNSPVYLSNNKQANRINQANQNNQCRKPQPQVPVQPKPQPQPTKSTALAVVASPAQHPQALKDNRNNKDIQPARTDKTVQPAQNTQKDAKPNQQSPVKRLVKRFKKSGLGIIDSYFNAYYFYYDWKGEKTGRKPKDYLATIARPPRGWGRDKTNDEVYEKNTYDKYLDFLTFIAKLWGFLCVLFKPLYNFFKSVTDFFSTFGNSSKAAKNIGYIAQKGFAVLLPVFSVIFTAMTIFNISAYKPELELTFNGQNIGFVDSKETVGKVISLLENNVSSVLHEMYEFTGDLSYKIVLTKNKSYVSEGDLYNLMYNSSQIQNSITTAYGLYIDGELVGAAENASDINIVLSEILEANSADIDEGTIEFVNEIKIIENKYAKRDVVTQNELKDIISYSAIENTQSDTPADAEYIIADNAVPLANGNSLFSEYLEYSDEPVAGAEDIAAMAAASSIELTPDAINTIPRGFLMLNENIKQDEVLSRLSRTSGSAAAGPIQFKKVKTENYTIEVPFQVKYVDSEKYYTGTQTVQTNGKNGENMITADVTYIGEIEVSREVKKVETVKDPVDKIVLVGTKVKPVAAPTGAFIRPVKGGSISCSYGGGHRAIDIPRPSGTTVMAADGGTVIFAGYAGSYGNCVKIKHSDGFVTLYAHFSSISVSYGDKVFQGQEIGKVGSTGYSTGNHLHFEVIKNGVQVNPLSYLK